MVDFAVNARKILLPVAIVFPWWRPP